MCACRMAWKLVGFSYFSAFLQEQAMVYWRATECFSLAKAAWLTDSRNGLQLGTVQEACVVTVWTCKRLSRHRSGWSGWTLCPIQERRRWLLQVALCAEDPEPHPLLSGHDWERQRSGSLRLHLSTGSSLFPALPFWMRTHIAAYTSGVVWLRTHPGSPADCCLWFCVRVMICALVFLLFFAFEFVVTPWRI